MSGIHFPPRGARGGRVALLLGVLVAGASGAEVRAAESGASPESPPALVGYDPDRGAFIRTSDGSWELNPYAMVQLQHVTLLRDGGIASDGFVLRSAKLIFHGHIFNPALTYHFQMNGGEGRFVMEDVYLRADVARWMSLLAGQIEVPYNRQHITLEAYQELVGRSTVDTLFTLQRDLGLAAYLYTPDHGLEATVGVWNGSRQNAPNDDRSYLTTLRLAWNPWGPIAFREADLDDSASPKLSIAAAGAVNPERRIAMAGSAEPDVRRHIAQMVLEGTLRYRGLSVSIEAHARRERLADDTLATTRGAFAQVGYFLVPHHLELVGRLAGNGGALAPDDVRFEAIGGVSYYLRGHRLKVQADGGLLENASGQSTLQLRAQLQFFL